jgi:hypothetical protein
MASLAPGIAAIGKNRTAEYWLVEMKPASSSMQGDGVISTLGVGSSATLRHAGALAKSAVAGRAACEPPPARTLSGGSRVFCTGRHESDAKEGSYRQGGVPGKIQPNMVEHLEPHFWRLALEMCVLEHEARSSKP